MLFIQDWSLCLVEESQQMASMINPFSVGRYKLFTAISLFLFLIKILCRHLIARWYEERHFTRIFTWQKELCVWNPAIHIYIYIIIKLLFTYIYIYVYIHVIWNIRTYTHAQAYTYTRTYEMNYVMLNIKLTKNEKIRSQSLKPPDGWTEQKCSSTEIQSWGAKYK